MIKPSLAQLKFDSQGSPSSESDELKKLNRRKRKLSKMLDRLRSEQLKALRDESELGPQKVTLLTDTNSEPASADQKAI